VSLCRIQSKSRYGLRIRAFASTRISALGEAEGRSQSMRAPLAGPFCGDAADRETLRSPATIAENEASAFLRHDRRGGGGDGTI